VTPTSGIRRASRSLRGEEGFNLVELVAVCAITAIIFGLTVPWMLTAIRAYNATRGAREIRAALNQARAVAITTRQSICFTSVTGGYAFKQGSCAGTAWVGPDTNASGIFTPASAVTLSGGSPVFTQFGTASTTGVITVTSATGTSQTVTVQPSGRVTIP